MYVVPDVLMTNWSACIKRHYLALLKNVETKYGLREELIQLQSSTFPLPVLNMIWVIFVQIFFSYFTLLTVVGMSK